MTKILLAGLLVAAAPFAGASPAYTASSGGSARFSAESEPAPWTPVVPAGETRIASRYHHLTVGVAVADVQAAPIVPAATDPGPLAADPNPVGIAEPGSFVLLALGVFVLLARRRV